MAERILIELDYLWIYSKFQFLVIFKYWALGMLIGSVISVFGKEKIHIMAAGLKNTRLGTLGCIPASLLGIASPLCMYGTVPVAAALARKDLREDWIAAFMMASILLNPQLLIYSAALGSHALILRFVFCFLGGVTAGLMVSIFYKDKSFFKFSEFSKLSNHDTDSNLVIRLYKNIHRNIKITLPYFLLGIFLTALYQRYVPQEAFSSLFGSHKNFGILLASTIGVPFYVCGGGTIPLLAVWLKTGMSMGAGVAFMITGPATKITNLGALKIVLGAKNFGYYIVYVIIFSIISGSIVDHILILFQ